MKRTVYTERAHYMTPNMNFAIAAEICAEYDFAKVQHTLDLLKAAHPLLSSVISVDKDKNVVYKNDKNMEIPVFVKDNADNWLADYDEITKTGWDLRKDCLMRVIVYPKGNCTFVVFAVHHLLCDGKALCDFALTFADMYANSSSCGSYEDRTIASAEELRGNLKLPFFIKYIVNSANKKWSGDKNPITYDKYRDFELSYCSSHTINKSLSSMSSDKLDELKSQCREKGVTINDYLIAQMMTDEKNSTVIIGADIRKYYSKYEEGALGNYSSAYSVGITKLSEDVWEVASYVSKAVGKIKSNPRKELLTLALYASLDQELLDVAAISACGNHKSEAGLFVGDRLLGLKTPRNYTITNLGSYESSTVSNAFFVPPASPSAKRIDGVITVNGVMNTVSAQTRLS